MFKYWFSAIWFAMAVPAYTQTVPDLSDLSPDEMSAAPENNAAMDLSIGEIYTSGEPDREVNGCIVPGRPDWIIEINRSRNVEQWLVSEIWGYLGGSRVVETENCACELRYPSWGDAIEHFNANYAGMERIEMDRIRQQYVRKRIAAIRESNNMCEEGYR